MSTPAFIPTATIEPSEPAGFFTVWTEWKATGGTVIDAPRKYGICLRKAEARRAKEAIDAGAAYGPAKLARDASGKTYVEAECKLNGRHIKYCLSLLGF